MDIAIKILVAIVAIFVIHTYISPLLLGFGLLGTVAVIALYVALVLWLLGKF